MNEHELYEAIWNGQANGFSQATLIRQRDEAIETLAQLNAKRITPAKVIGSGVRSPLTTAREYLQGCIKEATLGLETRGRSVNVNQANVRYHLNKQALANKE